MRAGLIAVAVALSIVGAAPAMAVTPLADSKTGEPGSNETLATPVGRSGVTVYLSNGSYGQTDLYWKPAPCMWPYQTGECGDVYLDVVTKGPDGANLYSFDAPVRVVLACPDAVCAPVTTRRPYDPWIDYRAYRQAVSLKVNGEYPSTSLAPPCQPRSAGRKARGVIASPAARSLGFCMDVNAFRRRAGALDRVVLFVEDPRFLAISR